MRPVFARVEGELRATDPSNVQGPVKQDASPGEQYEAPRPRWKPWQEQNQGPENQDSQHMLNPGGLSLKSLKHGLRCGSRVVWEGGDLPDSIQERGIEVCRADRCTQRLKQMQRHSKSSMHSNPHLNMITIDTNIKAKRNNMISELITFRITKAKAKVKFGVEESMWT